MRYKYYFLILALLWSCGGRTNATKQATNYGCYKEKDKIVLLDITSFKSFGGLLQSVERVVCNDSIPAVEVQHEHGNSILTLGNPCSKKYICILRRKRNVLEIIDDNIIVDKKFPLDSLELLMRRHYHNNGASEFYADKPQKATISITYKSNKLEKLNYLLTDIVDAFENIDVKDLTCLNVLLEEDKQI